MISATAQALYGPFDPAASIWVPRADDHNPSDSGQYGVALRYFASNLNDTEFGFYFENYHSRTPILSGTKGKYASVLTGGPLVAPICGVPALVALCTTGTARYFAEYPENIRLFGVSFNTAGPYGVALQRRGRCGPLMHAAGEQNHAHDEDKNENQNEVIALHNKSFTTRND